LLKILKDGNQAKFWHYGESPETIRKQKRKYSFRGFLLISCFGTKMFVVPLKSKIKFWETNG